MRHTQRTRTLVLFFATAAVAALAGCGGNSASHGAPGSPAPSASHPATSAPAPTASPSPTAAAPSPTKAVPSDTVVSSRVTYAWHWPNDGNRPGSVQHASAVPPLPTLVAIGAGDHRGAPGERPYNRISFTFTGGFPSYQFGFTNALASDPSGRPVPLADGGALKVTFRQAQAHDAGGRTSVVSQPPSWLGMSRMLSWAQAGDFEGVLTYSIGIAMPVAHSNPQFMVRAIEVAKVTGHGQHLYLVAIDVDVAPMMRG